MINLFISVTAMTIYANGIETQNSGPEIRLDISTNSLSVYLRQWKVIGPFPVADLDDDAVEGDVEPEKSEQIKGRSWQTVDSPTNHLDLIDLYKGHQISKHVAYPHTYVNSPVSMEVSFLFSCTNGGKLWVNGTLVDSQVQADDECYDFHLLPVDFEAGWNRVLIKHHTTGENPSAGLVDPWVWRSSLKIIDQHDFAVTMVHQVDPPSNMNELLEPPGVWYRPHVEGNISFGKIAEVSMPYRLFFSKHDVPVLRGKIASGRLSQCNGLLDLITDHYLENLQPDTWSFELSDGNVVDEVEKYMIRLAFKYVLTEATKYAELARRIAIRVCQLKCSVSPKDLLTLQRGLACTLDWTANRLSQEERNIILAGLPKDFAVRTKSPVENLSINLESQCWMVWKDSNFGVDFKLAAVIAPQLVGTLFMPRWMVACSG